MTQPVQEEAAALQTGTAAQAGAQAQAEQRAPRRARDARVLLAAERAVGVQQGAHQIAQQREARQTHAQWPGAQGPGPSP